MQKREEVLEGKCLCKETPCGRMYVTVNLNAKRQPTEVFCMLGKSGTCGRAFLEALGRTITLGLRNGVGIEEFRRTLKGINCQFGTEGCPNAVGECLEMIEKKEGEDAGRIE